MFYLICTAKKLAQPRRKNSTDASAPSARFSISGTDEGVPSGPRGPKNDSKPLELFAKTTMKAHPYPWHAHEDPDVGDNSCDPGDGMPVRPCEHALILFHVG